MDHRSKLPYNNQPALLFQPFALDGPGRLLLLTPYLKANAEYGRAWRSRTPSHSGFGTAIALSANLR
eukprot:scaffold1197_cov228-Pinguiococcus_pyrenoidosus.AAC.9